MFSFLAVGSAADLSFNRDIRPILSENCYYCHGFDSNHRKAKLRLDSLEGATEDHDGTKAIVPRDLAKSAVWQRIISDDSDEVMPPPETHKKLTTEQKVLLKKWIEQGAKYEAHWAFVAPIRPAVPRLADLKLQAKDWKTSENPIDAFIAQGLITAGLQPSPEATPEALIRRMTLDLTGLPPTLAEVDGFIADSNRDPKSAIQNLVDRLLKSPRYGEHMAMAWLDAARYADTNGFQGDAYRMNWPWRDWVVNAYNDNMPFDRFTIEQLAGDLLEKPTNDQMVATAFNRNHALNAEGGTIPEENRTKNVFDRVETTSGVWLGMTMQCCQCHDHKFDPLKQSDYYGMYALFNQISEPGGVDKRFGKKPYSDDYDKLYAIESPYITMPSGKQEEELKAAAKVRESAIADFNARKQEFIPSFTAWVEEMRAKPVLIEERISGELDRRAVSSAKIDNLFDGNTQRLLEIYFKLDGNAKWADLKHAIDKARIAEDGVTQTIPHVMVMRDDKPRETHILLRGNYETPGDKVEPCVPAFLPALPVGMKTNRLALAKWLVSPEQPLMSRVTVNRLWQQFFGHGLVKTPDDFGMQGALPSHPELLDWLAVEFRESGWDVKKMIRLIVTSKAYRQSSVVTAEMLAKDPENALLAHGPRYRLDSRVLRDQALALSGLLVEQRGGAAVMPYQPPGIWEEMSFGKNRYFQGKGDELHRRSLYTFWRRSVAPTMFFDVPARQVCSVKPQRTSTPLQALTMLNDTTFVEAARAWAESLTQSEKDDTARLGKAFRAATARAPDAREVSAMNRLLQKAREHFNKNESEAHKLVSNGDSRVNEKLPAEEQAAWTTVCLMILNLDETLNK